MGTLWGHHAVSGVWLYSSLDWSRASSIIKYIGLMFLVLLSWFAWCAEQHLMLMSNTQRFCVFFCKVCSCSSGDVALPVLMGV